MTLIISAHLGDCILIAADNRAMRYNLEKKVMRLATNHEQKIKLWCRGAITGSGETIFLDRIAQYFMNITDADTELKQMDVIHNEVERRLSEGISQKNLFNNVIIFSMFDGCKTLLYSIPIEPFFQYFEKDGIQMIRPHIHEITDWTVDVSCFNIPPDMSNLQKFQRNLKPMKYFSHQQEFIDYYIQNLKHIFTTHASIDPSITTSFDLYIQSCKTGNSVMMHIPNNTLSTTVGCLKAIEPF